MAGRPICEGRIVTGPFAVKGALTVSDAKWGSGPTASKAGLSGRLGTTTPSMPVGVGFWVKH